MPVKEAKLVPRMTFVVRAAGLPHTEKAVQSPAVKFRRSSSVFPAKVSSRQLPDVF